jgi:aspartate/methionine/tyrosine aminotransferase
MMAEFTERRDVVVDGLNAIPGIRCHKPAGAFYVFPNIEGTGWDERSLQQALLNEAGVALLAGTAFGAYGRGYLRLSYANSVTNLEKGVERIGNLLAGKPPDGSRSAVAVTS